MNTESVFCEWDELVNKWENKVKKKLLWKSNSDIYLYMKK